MNTVRFSSTLLAVAFCLATVILLRPPSNCTAGTYTSSAHGHATDGVSRKDLNTRTTATGGQPYKTGNCAHCHEQHASLGGSEPEPNTPAGPANYLGMDQEAASPNANAEQTLCFYCHATIASNNESSGAPDDIETDITKTYGHDLTISDTAHRAHESLSDIATGAEHIECTDCHNPHAANKTIHTKGLATSNTIPSTSPLYGATGADPGYPGSGSSWTQPAQNDYTLQQPATKEYQICFKCHSGSVDAALNPATWSVTSGAEAWTDVGLEFSPLNKSGHPVVTGLQNYPNSSNVQPFSVLHKGLEDQPDGSDYDQLFDDPWGTDPGYQTMYCTDCHEGVNAAGPHGSDTKWMLAGTNKAWPYLTKAMNGTNETENTVDYPANFTEKFRRLENIRTDIDNANGNGLFCANCHPASSYAYDQGTYPPSNNVHAEEYHVKARCVACHIRVPHGGKISRLIAAENNATYTNIPARYRGSGDGYNGSGGNVPSLGKFTKSANNNYNQGGTCYSISTDIANATSGTKLCNFHGVGGTESW